MHRRTIFIFVVAGLMLSVAAVATIFLPTTVQNTGRHGMHIGPEKWRGTITITGDVLLLGDLSIDPGTTVRFEVGDDQHSGDEVPADGYNDNDPTRLLAYGKTHSNIIVLGKVIAIGSKNAPIIFTSASTTPHLADWEAIIFNGDGSIIDSAVVEYSRNGINPIGDQSHSMLRHNDIRHTMWGGISSGHSSVRVIDNHISDCGHEGVDVQGGDQIVRGNVIEDCHAGIVILGGSPTVENNVIRNAGDDIHVVAGATPKMSGNTFVPAPPDSSREWRYDNFAYTMY